MGMFDYLKCSSDIGELTNEECQTKEIDRYGGTMSFYWVDPSGVLWYIDYSGTANFDINDDEDTPIWRRMKIVPNGNKGRIAPYYLTDYVTIYRSRSSPDGMLDTTTCRLHFVDGVLQSYTYK